MNRIIILIALIIISFGVKAQNYQEIVNADECLIKESYSEHFHMLYMIRNHDDSDTLWVTYLPHVQTSNNQGKIISMDKNLNILSNTTIRDFVYGPILSEKINDKFYSIIYDVSLDTILFTCLDRNANVLIKKPIWINDGIDTLLMTSGFNLLALSNKTFLLAANVTYPTTSYEALDAVKFMIIDTMANIINSEIYSQKASWLGMSMCEVGDYIVIDKEALPIDTGNFSTYGTSYMNKFTLGIEDSIPRKWFIDTLPRGGHGRWSGYMGLGNINDSIYAGIYPILGNPVIRVMNANTKNLLSKITYTIKGGDELPSRLSKGYGIGLDANINSPDSRFAYNNFDSIYVAYRVHTEPRSYEYGRGWIELINFGVNGDINFVYRFTVLDSIYVPVVTGMKTLDDGSLFMTISHCWGDQGTSWLIKFNPNGLVNLTNVETGERELIRVYPNPAKNYIEVDIEAERFSSSEIELFDMQGRMVKRAKLAGRKGNRIDVSSLQPGAYTYSVSLNEKAFSGKIIVGN